MCEVKMKAEEEKEEDDDEDDINSVIFAYM
jgi:hypothetical protein